MSYFFCIFAPKFVKWEFVYPFHAIERPFRKVVRCRLITDHNRVDKTQIRNLPIENIQTYRYGNKYLGRVYLLRLEADAGA